NNIAGVEIQDAASNAALIQDNAFYGNAIGGNEQTNLGLTDQNYGVFSRGLDPVILRNEAYHTNGRVGYGMDIQNAGANALVQDNLVHDNSQTGLILIGTNFEASGNVARENSRGFFFQDSDGGAALARA